MWLVSGQKTLVASHFEVSVPLANSTMNIILGASQVVLVVKSPPASVRHIRDTGSIPGSGRSPGGGYGNPLQYSCLENPMDWDSGGLQSMGLQRVRQGWVTNTAHSTSFTYKYEFKPCFFTCVLTYINLLWRLCYTYVYTHWNHIIYVSYLLDRKGLREDGKRHT